MDWSGLCIFVSIQGYIQKFPDWLPGARTANSMALAASCSCITILWVSLVSFATITLCVASQQVFIVVIYFVVTQSGNIWIYPHISRNSTEFSGSRFFNTKKGVKQ